MLADTKTATRPEETPLAVAINQPLNNGGSIMANKGNDNRGFGSMDDKKQKDIASKGGKSAHEQGQAHEFDSEEAREAGEKGGQVAHETGNAHEFDSEEARQAGQKGGQVAHETGNAHEFDSEEARKAGKKGGQRSQGGRSS